MLLKQALDFKDESNYLFNILKNLSNAEFEQETLFKKWSINTILRHLHVWNYAAILSLTKINEWEKFSSDLSLFLSKGKSLNDFETEVTKNIKNKELLNKWQELYEELSENKIKLNDIRFFLGCSSWSNGQLEKELDEKSWEPFEIVSTEKVLKMKIQNMWKKCMISLGGKYRVWSNAPENPNFN